MEEKENDKIVDLTKRLRPKEKGAPTEVDRFEAIRKAVICFLCQFRCSMCGVQIERDVGRNLNLCKGCFSEYEDYLNVKGGKQVELRPYQDETWMKVWKKWEELRDAMIEFKDKLSDL